MSRYFSVVKSRRPKRFQELQVAVRRTIAVHGLLAKDDRVLLALSGGADSVCLLYVLQALVKPWHLTLHAFHLNHQLRGSAADRDERFVRRFCRKLGVPLTVERVDVRAWAREHKHSLETAGREVRYARLEALARELNCTKVATAHNADDNAETVLLNLVRGTGMTGLTGIPVRRGRLVRPLLEVERPAIEAALKERRIAWCRDASNEHLEFRRNLVRHRVVPLLKRLNPQFVAAVGRTATVLRDEDDWLDRGALRAMAEVVTALAGDNGAVSHLLDIERLGNYNVAIRRRMLKLMLPQLSATEVAALLDLVPGKTGRRVNLSGQLQAWRERDKLVVAPISRRRVYPATEVCVPGTTDLAGFDLTLRTEIKARAGKPANRKAARRELFDMAEIELPLVARTRRAGDRMTPFGGREKKLKVIMIDDGVPQRLRDSLPVLCDCRGILWVVGSRRAERARVTARTKQVLAVTAS